MSGNAKAVAVKRIWLAQFVVYFYILFSGVLVFFDAYHRLDYLGMLYGIAALPTAFVFRFLRKS